MTELAHRTNQQVVPHMNMNEKMQYAQALAQAPLLPKQYHRNPGNVFLAIELGESLGLPPIQAINTVHVIEGKPSASAALISALVRRAGHTLRVRGNDQEATAEIVRADDPEFTYSVTWTMERARQAGSAGKDNWRKYPAAMLKARAITEVARDACQEALMGVQYTPEELGATVDEEGNPVAQRGPQRPQAQRFGLAGNFNAPHTPAQATQESAPAPGRDVPQDQPAAVGEESGPAAEPEPAAVEGSSRSQWIRAGNLMTDLGIEDKAEKTQELRTWAAEAGITREIGSMKDLTSQECDQFIGYLTSLAAPMVLDNTEDEAEVVSA